MAESATATIVLVPGFWLGAWAWDEVVAQLGADGHDVRAVTLPGLADLDEDRSGVTYEDHVGAIVDVVTAADGPVVLASHSGAAGAAYVASDRVPERIAAMVYVDTGPPTAPMDPSFEGDELPMPDLETLTAQEPVDGLTDEHLARFRDRAVPEPGAILRDLPDVSDDRRLDLPSTVICTGYTSEMYRDAVAEGQTWLGALAHLRDVAWVDLPTSHWPMWSRPADLAAILGEVARQAG